MKHLPRLAALALVLGSAGSAVAQDSRPPAYTPPALPTAEVQKVLRVLEPRNRRALSTDELVRELVGIGAGAAPVYVAILAGDLAGTDWEGSGLSLEEARSASAGEEQLLTEALRHLQPNAVGRALRAACAGDAPLDRRLVGLHLLADVGQDEDAVQTWLALAGGIEEIHLQRAYVRAQLEQALAACLQRSAACFQALSRGTRTWERKLLPALVQACAQSERRQGVEVLCGLCRIDRELDLTLLAQLPALAEASVGGLDDMRLTWVRSFLADSDPLVRASSATALGRLCDPVSAAQLADALADADPRVAQAAHWSLRRLSGQRLGASREDWERWLRDEQRWLDEERPAAVEALEDVDPAHAVAGLQQLAQHPLYRHENAAAIAGLRERESADVLVAACAALRQLGSLAATDMLAALLVRPEAEVRAAAHQALQALTGRQLPCEAEAWQQALGG